MALLCVSCGLLLNHARFIHSLKLFYSEFPMHHIIYHISVKDMRSVLGAGCFHSPSFA